jgi:hypothetical protein
MKSIGILERPMLTPADESEERLPAIFYRDHFVLLTDDLKCWIVRIEDISLLEAVGILRSCIFPTASFSVGALSTTASAGWTTPSSFAPAGAALSTLAT